jgi:hypothetical protein
MDPAPPDLAAVLAALPLYAPVGETRTGRISSTTVDPGGRLPFKAVVDFGSTPDGADRGPDIEIASRRWDRDPAPGARELRAFCAERDLMERRARDPLSADAFGPAADAAWSTAEITVDGAVHPFTVLATGTSWVAAGRIGADLLVRVFTPAPGPGPRALRRVTAPAELAPMRGRG